MREIKFRGKRIDNNEWIYGSLIIEPILPGFRCVYSDIRNSGKSEYLIYPMDCNEGRAKEVIPETVGQYTGLKDNSPSGKEKVEVYEGDIIRIYTFFCEEEPGLNESTVHKIEYKIEQDFPGFDLEPFLDCECNGIAWAMCDMECVGFNVVGNIYENPELLEGKK